MGFDKDGYWSPREILGYNAKYNIILSERGRGKTVALKKLMVQQDGEFMCLYRDGKDLEHSIKSWTGDLVRFAGYDPDQFTWEGDEGSAMNLYMDGKLKGYFRYLTGANHIKQENFPDTLNYVWLDEFIPILWKKLPGVKSEGKTLRTIMKTIDHDTVHPRETRGFKKLRCFLVGNPHTWDNPMLSYFHVGAELGYGVHRIGPDIVLEHIAPLEKEDDKEDVESFLGAEVHRADGWKEELDFICPIPKAAVPIFSVRVESQYFHILRASDGRLFVTSAAKHAQIGKTRIYGGLVARKAGERALEKSTFLKSCEDRILSGGFCYPDVNTKFAWQNALEDL